MNRKEIKAEAKKVVKKHYLLSVAICLMAMLFSSVFINQMENNLVVDKINEVMGEDTVGMNRFSISDESYWTVLEDIHENDLDKAQNDVDKALENYQQKQTDILGRSQGVIASLINTVCSGEILVLAYDSITSMMGGSGIGGFLLILLAVGFQLAVIIFLKNMIHLIMNRIFLEESTYDHVPIQHVFYFDAVNRWIKSALSYLRYNIQLSLWYLTIIGGFIKEYSYAMVPYILAENPDISGKDAIALSRKMMDGHKMELFKLDLSMLGWFVLDYFTIGITGIFWSNPYYTAVLTQYYRNRRRACMEAQMEGIEVLNDTYLYELPQDEALNRAYRDVRMDQMYIADNQVELHGIQKFFVENLSIWVGSTKNKRTWQAIESIKAQISNDEAVLDKKAYPSRLSPLYVRARKHFNGQRDFMRAYTVQSLVLIFFIFAIGGWLWETGLCLVQSGEFANRGTMLGPWLPIYGAGAILALIVLTKLRKHPLATFTGAFILSGVIEYGTATVLESMYGLKWWDYSGYFLNLNGRICLEGLILFAFGCMAVIYAIAPELDNLLEKADARILSVVSIVLAVLFGMDAVSSLKNPNTGKNITSPVTEVHTSQSE